ncbi:MAG: hypothetical protein ACRED5_03060 [Propylenella sp.]
MAAMVAAAQFSTASAQTSVEGRWALSRSTGIQLPRGSCSASGADEFSMSDNRLTWNAPSRLRIPALELRIVSGSINVPSMQGVPIPMLLNVSDGKGRQGKIWISRSQLVHRYNNGVELQFRYCG